MKIKEEMFVMEFTLNYNKRKLNVKPENKNMPSPFQLPIPKAPLNHP